MPEIGTLGLMSGDGKQSVGHRPQATAPILDSTDLPVSAGQSPAALPGSSDVDFLRDLKRVVDLYAQIPNRTFDLQMAE